MIFRIAGMVFWVAAIAGGFVAHDTGETGGYIMCALFATVGTWLVFRKNST